MDDAIREFRVRPVIERGCASLEGVQGGGVSWDEKAVARFSA